MVNIQSLANYLCMDVEDLEMVFDEDEFNSMMSDCLRAFYRDIGHYYQAKAECLKDFKAMKEFKKITVEEF